MQESYQFCYTSADGLSGEVATLFSSGKRKKAQIQ